MLELNNIYCGDCLELMNQIEDKSVNLILCDLPYGVTQNPEDQVLDLEKLWKTYKRILKEDGKIVLTSQFPFTLDLVNSNREWFKYDLIWNKTLTSGFLNANHMPLRVHEHILIFYKTKGTYNPQKIKGKENHSRGENKITNNQNYGVHIVKGVDNGFMKHPTSILTIPKTHPSKAKHPTEKPVELAEWVIKSYTNEGDIVLDNCIGTGWTAIASKINSRNFIGFDINKEYVSMANARIKEVLAQTKLNQIVRER